jgi:hypothetical protein
MDNNLNSNDMVQRYVLGMLSEEETATMQTRLLFNKQLRQEVESFRTIRKELSATRLSTPAPTGKMVGYRALLIGSLLLAGLVSIVAWRSSRQQPAVPAPVPVVQPTGPIASAPSNPSAPVAAIPSTVAEKAPAETTKPIVSNETIAPVTAQPEDNGAPALLAQLDPEDYAPYPYLEQMTSGMRGDEGVITLFKPINGQQFKGAAEKIVLPFEGNIVSRKQPYDFHLAIYSNKPRDFETDSPVLHVKVPLEKVNDMTWTFAMQTSVRLKPGLYYFILTTREGTMTTVSKFTVHP